MPYRSLAQERYFNANRSKMEGAGVNVDEWNKASKGMNLPRRAAVKMKTKRVDLGEKGSFSEKPGALHEDLGIPLGEKLPKGREEAAAHGSGKTARRARAALGFRAMNHGK